ncbi:hypothetical protein FKR81_10690 [Lentzea tibetensis]|uniref:Putative zinc-finger domain-containing protein n=1 Tax=Lentzea tibetensis TaxID=2591470 RepID=A0A563EWG2_9PSEU|nr:hypothetical protein [Lentzea tibetensis]TWP52046.1 hypothetical protein FKR81_10690 [Lentzea tibetensis]
MTAGAHDSVTLGCYALGVLDAHERRGVEQHLSWCGQCRAQVADFSRVRSVLDGIPREALVEELRPAQPLPMPSELVLQRALRQIRSEGATRGEIPAPRASPQSEVVEDDAAPGQHRRSRKSAYIAVAAVVAAMAFGAGAVVMGQTGTEKTPTAQPPSNVLQDGATRRLVNKDSKTGVDLVADVTNMQGWVKIQVQVAGLPAGQSCQLIVVGKDGRREVVKGWVSTEKARIEGWTGSGSASIPPADVTAVSIENEDGKRFVTAQTS